MKKVPFSVAEFYLLYKATKLIYGSKSYLYQKGFHLSVRKKLPVNKEGEPLPWMNYSIIDFLTDRLNTDMDLFEYGCGFSTLFFQKRVKTVTSVESHHGWYKKMSSVAAGNVKIIYCPDDENDRSYAESINKSEGNFDVILVDGKDRVNCMKNAAEKLKENGVILLDDSDRQQYAEGFEFMKEMGFRKLNFRNLKPAAIDTHQTTLFYKPGNCMNL